MERLNSEGIPRNRLSMALRQPLVVIKARKMNACLLCRRRGVNEAGLCDPCYSQLPESELRLALRWLTGEAP